MTATPSPVMTSMASSSTAVPVPTAIGSLDPAKARTGLSTVAGVDRWLGSGLPLCGGAVTRESGRGAEVRGAGTGVATASAGPRATGWTAAGMAAGATLLGTTAGLVFGASVGTAACTALSG